MGYVIPLQSRKRRRTPSPYEIKATWFFMRAALWPGQRFSKKEEASVLERLKELLPENHKAPLTGFYIRILLERSRLQLEMSAYLPKPSLWLRPGYPDGYSATAYLINDLAAGHPNIPGYREQLYALADGYYQYQRSPCTRNFTLCQRALQQLKAYSLLQLFYEAAACNEYAPADLSRR